MDRIKSAFDFIFSSYKRAAALLFVFAVLLAIPVTVSMIESQQDVRQRASELSCEDLRSRYEALMAENQCSRSNEDMCDNLRDRMSDMRCFSQTSTTCIPKPERCSLRQYAEECADREPREGWCPAATSAPPTSFPSPTGEICAQVLTFARNTTTNDCQDFPTACLPNDWTADPTCQNDNPLTLTPAPTSSNNNPCTLKSSGDANCDGKVNTDDFNAWRDEFLQVTSNKSSDYNNDATINTDDFNIWRDGFLNANVPH